MCEGVFPNCKEEGWLRCVVRLWGGFGGGEWWLGWVLRRGFWGRGEIRKGGVRTKQQPLIWRRWGFLGCKNAPFFRFLLLKCIFWQRPHRRHHLKKRPNKWRLSNLFFLFYCVNSVLSITSLIIINLSNSTCLTFSMLSLITLSSLFSLMFNSSKISIL